MVKIKRIYEDPSKDDGYRVLVDRLWPRGISRERAKLDLWLKDIAPSTELRKWFGHDESKFYEFEINYRHELDNLPDLITELMEIAQSKDITLLYSAKDEYNNAIVLKDYLDNK